MQGTGWGTGCMMQDAWYRMMVQDAWFRMQGTGCRIQDAGCRIQNAGCRVQDVFRMQG